MTPERAQRFAAAFGVPAEWLSKETASLDAFEGSMSQRERRILEAGSLVSVRGLLVPTKTGTGSSAHRRLQAARILAQLATPAEASAVLGVPRTTYAGHETGERGMNAQFSRFYAVAFAVAPRWLLDGTGPSGLPCTSNWMDERWNGPLDDLSHAPSPDPSRLASKAVLKRASRLIELKAAIFSSETAAGLTVPQVEPSGSDGLDVVGEWSLPPSAIRDTGCAEGAALIIMKAGVASEAPFSAGEYLLVDIAPERKGSVGDYIAQRREGEVIVAAWGPSGETESFLGFVQGRLLSPLT